MYKTTFNKVIRLISIFEDAFKDEVDLSIDGSIFPKFKIIFSHKGMSEIEFKNRDGNFDSVLFKEKIKDMGYKTKIKNIKKYTKIFIYEKAEKNNNCFFCYSFINGNRCSIIFYEEEVI